MIKNCVNILKLDYTSLFIGGTEFRVGSVEVTATTTSNGIEHRLVSNEHLS